MPINTNQKNIKISGKTKNPSQSKRAKHEKTSSSAAALFLPFAESSALPLTTHLPSGSSIDDMCLDEKSLKVALVGSLAKIDKLNTEKDYIIKQAKSTFKKLSDKLETAKKGKFPKNCS